MKAFFYLQNQINIKNNKRVLMVENQLLLAKVV
jgi:hypothetical protein